jgi:hypothetical protein
VVLPHKFDGGKLGQGIGVVLALLENVVENSFAVWADSKKKIVDAEALFPIPGELQAREKEGPVRIDKLLHAFFFAARVAAQIELPEIVDFLLTCHSPILT